MSALARLLRSLEIDLRLLGMLGALVVIWLVFHAVTGGLYLTPRNLFNLSVQTSSVAVMATGMVFVIVTRNIDLSVGSLLGLLGMIMAVTQVRVLPEIVGLGHWSIWIVAILVGLAAGALIGGFQGWLIGYLTIPSFIVTLGGLLVWRGAAWWITTGQTVAPLDPTFALLGGGAERHARRPRQLDPRRARHRRRGGDAVALAAGQGARTASPSSRPGPS